MSDIKIISSKQAASNIRRIGNRSIENVVDIGKEVANIKERWEKANGKDKNGFKTKCELFQKDSEHFVFAYGTAMKFLRIFEDFNSENSKIKAYLEENKEVQILSTNNLDSIASSGGVMKAKPKAEEKFVAEKESTTESPKDELDLFADLPEILNEKELKQFNAITAKLKKAGLTVSLTK